MKTNDELREALVEARKVIKSMGGYWATETLPIIDAALATPPRNCDRFATLPDALAAWRDIDPREAGPFDLWLFDTVKEGGAK